MIPNSDQTAIYNFVESTCDSLVVEAYAGTGKTTTIVEASNLIDPNLSTTFVAFNKSIALELQGRLASNIRASTLHSLGYKAIMRANPKTKMDENKNRGIYRSMRGDPETQTAVVKLISVAKTIDSRRPDFDELIDRFEILVEADKMEYVLDFARDAFAKSVSMTDVVDFDDMVYMPAIGLFQPWRSDVMFVDERQDLNRAQVSLIRRALKTGGRMIAVGDMHQAIYAFRGADSSAMIDLANEFYASQLPLSVCYRCPRLIIHAAQQIVPQIQPAPNAIEGTIDYLKEDKITTTAKPGDMILCRTNAPLVSIALKLISHGIKAQVRGRDIGKSVASLIKRIQRHYYGVELVPQFLSAMREYVDSEVAKLLAAEKIGNASALVDQMETVIAISSGAGSVNEILQRLETIFSDTVEGVLCSSIHKAKGLEADHVFILRPDLLPHPMAKTPIQREQEMNLKYVAITRAKQILTWMQQ